MSDHREKVNQHYFAMKREILEEQLNVRAKSRFKRIIGKVAIAVLVVYVICFSGWVIYTALDIQETSLMLLGLAVQEQQMMIMEQYKNDEGEGKGESDGLEYYYEEDDGPKVVRL